MADLSLRLREVRPCDAYFLHCWRNDPATRSMFRNTEEIPYTVHEGFMTSYFGQGNRDRWFVIEECGERIGAIALYNLSANGKEAEWGRFTISAGSRGRGMGRRALLLLMGHARLLGVEFLHCEVLAGNEIAAGLYRRLGFAETSRTTHAGRVFVRLTTHLQERS